MISVINTAGQFEIIENKIYQNKKFMDANFCDLAYAQFGLTGFLEKELIMADSSNSKTLDDLTQKIGAVSLQELLPREYYIHSRLNSTNPKQQALLEKKLDPTYSEKQLNITRTQEAAAATQQAQTAAVGWSQVAKGGKKSRPVKVELVQPELITKESKLAAYAQALGAEFDELEALKAKETEILEAYATAEFKPQTVARGYFEHEEARVARELKLNQELRQKMIKDNRDQVLLRTLKSAIRATPSAMPEGQERLDKEEKAQEILSPLYGRRVDERMQDVARLRTDREAARYYAKAPLLKPKKLANDVPALASTLDARQRFSAMMMQKAMTPAVLSSEEAAQLATLDETRRGLSFTNPLRSDRASEMNRNVILGRELDGKAKKFKPIV
jgi:hypothetical protein